MPQPRRLVLPVLLMALALSGCLLNPAAPTQLANTPSRTGTSQPTSSSGTASASVQPDNTPEPAATPMGPLLSAWRFRPTPQDDPRGVVAHPTTGELYFTTRYGVTVLKPNGASRGYTEAKRLDGLRFAIDSPLISADGRSVFFSDWQRGVSLGLFAVDTGSRSLSKVPFDVGSPIAVDAHLGITAHAALSADGKRAYLPSGDLYVYDLETGRRIERHKLGGSAQQIVRLDSDRFLVNLTQEGDAVGTLVVFRASGQIGEVLEVPFPICAIAARPGWVVGISHVVADIFQLVELLPAADDSLEAQPAAGFILGGEKGNTQLSLALRPGKRQVAVGRPGIYPYGETKILDREVGELATAETQHVAGLTFSPDGKALYVAHSPSLVSSLEAFSLP
ncbi:hypothetical protein J7643_05885 [bacterium]|nr:hypothetical protein [bacterium]